MMMFGYVRSVRLRRKPEANASAPRPILIHSINLDRCTGCEKRDERYELCHVGSAALRRSVDDEYPPRNDQERPGRETAGGRSRSRSSISLGS